MSEGIFDKPVKITEKYLQFYSAAQLRDFAERYTPPEEKFEFAFAEPVKSGAGEVYIPAGMTINEARLENLDKFDPHNPNYRVQISAELLTVICQMLKRVFLSHLQGRRADFMQILFSDIPGSSFAGIIQNALFNRLNNEKRMLTLWLLKIYEQDRKSFRHHARFGMYALSVAFVIQRRGSFTHRYCFQGGLVADINGVNSPLLEEPMFDLPNNVKLDYALRAADASQKLGLEATVVDGLRNHLNPPDSAEAQAAEPAPTSFLDDEDDDEEEQAPDAGDEGDEDIAGAENDGADSPRTEGAKKKAGRAVQSILQITRFIMDAEKKKLDPEVQLKNLIAGLAYYSEKGALPPHYANPILAKCRSYGPMIRKMKIIARLESKCVKNDPDAAWAYPKPDASQVLCLKHRQDCPNFVQGRPLSIVSEYSEAFVAKPLAVGEYAKCTLARQLPE
ncbi:MAG: hypothetical protein NXI24_06045 [bacterium]|nr:hypothetical protein [bacterium]